MYTDCPTQAGKYTVSKNVRLHVSHSSMPYFVVKMRYARDGEMRHVETKFYVRTMVEFMHVQRMAIDYAYDMRSEIQKGNDVYFRQEIARKEEEHRARMDRKVKSVEYARQQARRDVEQVWKTYGPAIDLLQPFFIFQWDGQ